MQSHLLISRYDEVLETVELLSIESCNLIESAFRALEKGMDRSKIIAVVTGAIALLLGIVYLAVVQLLDFRGEMLPAPTGTVIGYPMIEFSMIGHPIIERFI